VSRTPLSAEKHAMTKRVKSSASPNRDAEALACALQRQEEDLEVLSSSAPQWS
jgi:hypothetical protein